MRTKTNNKLNFKQIILNYMIENSKKYILVTLIFLIGFFGGVMIINNGSEEATSQVSNYILDFIDKFKITEKIDTCDLITTSIKNNIILVCLLWFAGTTVIGVIFVFIILFFRGLSLGYTISAFTFAIGNFKGTIFTILALFLQNILFIPAIFTIGVSSIKLYKSILKDRRKENIKVEIIRHTIISCIMLVVLILSSLVENAISFTILQKMIKYF